MDPLAFFPSEISDEIFKHFTVSELLTATLVSKSWNEVIGASSRAMQRIKLSRFWLKEKMFLHDQVLDVLLSSQRKYQHIDFRYQSRYIDEIKTILSSNSRKWKSVKIARLSFHTTAHLIDFLKLVEKTVVELDLFDIYVASNVEADTLDFEKLKALRIKLVDVRGLFEKTFSKCRNLEKLSITSSYQSYDSLQAVLLQNPKLERLQISSEMFNDIFSLEIIREIPFKLKVFKSKNHYRGPIGAELVPFLEKQMNSLEELLLDNINSEALKVVFHLPKLKNLRLRTINFTDNVLSTLQLPVNQSIEVLSYHDIDNGVGTLESIIKATPNVKELKMYSLTQSMMTFLSTHATKLESLSLRTIDVDDMTNPQLFPSLKHVNVEIMTSSFEDHLQAIEKGKQNPFVKLVLQSQYVMLH